MSFFVRGKDVTLRVNGEILGGVRELSEELRSDGYDIMQVFSAVPVKRLSEADYRLEVLFDCTSQNPFEEEITDIEITIGNKICRYTDILPVSIKTSIKAGDRVFCRVVLDAKERSISE